MAKKKRGKASRPSQINLPKRERVPRSIQDISDADLRQRIIDAWHPTRFLLRAIPEWRSWCDWALQKKTADPRLPIELRVGVWRSLGTLCTLGAMPPSIRNNSPVELLNYFPLSLPGDVNTLEWTVDEEYISDCIERLNSESVLSLESELILLESQLIESPSIALDWQADEKPEMTSIALDWQADEKPEENGNGQANDDTVDPPADKPKWCSEDETERPSSYEHGPLTASLKVLSRWMGATDGLGRRVKEKQKNGLIWVCKRNRYSYSMWFNDQRRYAEANLQKIKEEKEKEPQVNTRKT